MGICCLPTHVSFTKPTNRAPQTPHHRPPRSPLRRSDRRHHHHQGSRAQGPHEEGLAALRAVLPTLLVYALSFTLTGIYWINHRHLMDRAQDAVAHIDNTILYANLAFLFTLSLTPFFTAYVLDKHFDSFAVALYGTSNMTSGFGFLLLRLAIHRHLRRNAALTREDTATQHKHWLSLALYLIAIPTAFVHPRLALTLIATVTLIWILPTIGIHSAEEDLYPPRHA